MGYGCLALGAGFSFIGVGAVRRERKVKAEQFLGLLIRIAEEILPQ